MKHEIRCKGTKSDEDLAREWILRGTLMWTCTAYGGGGPVDRSDIEKELGKDRLEFLVFKIKTEERLEKLESRAKNMPDGTIIAGGLSCCRKEKQYCNSPYAGGLLFLSIIVIASLLYFLP